ncbi:PucR family transcriptional regulator [Cellulomonas sp. PhB143]|uniref:PucR family transcriptional regulator n=1 Tax=Cellulomonas sp. PhB143 TaxID=2485186 RepID=UPI000F4960D0|nr:PucR family transcriptional regulator [Cellulomonas sp. PhB143]ROS75597.1 purine catabolism regulator [Cellulomonas sp. PhB143]
MTTVRDVLASPALALRGVHLPRPEEPVRWVATSELADPSPFLEGGEVLLTTGLETAGWGAGDDGRWDAYVARLAAVGVAAIGLGTGLTHAGVPDALARACRERSVNLVEVPRRTTFVAVSRLTGSLLAERERAAAQRAATMQQDLTEAAARAEGPAAVLRVLARHLDGGAALVDPGGAAARRDRAGQAPPEGLDLAAEIARIRPQGLRASGSVTVGTSTCVVQPVGLDRRPESYLAAWTTGALDDGRRGAVTTAVALLGLDAQRRREGRDASRRLRARALELLLDGDPRTAAVLLDADDRPGTVTLPATLRALEAAAGPAAPAGALDDALGALEEEAGVVLAAGAGPRLRLAVPAADAARAATVLAGLGCTVGVGEEVSRDAGPRTARTARHALAQATPALPVVRWDDLVDDGVLALLGEDAAASYAATFLAPLAGRPGLVDALRSFLRHHGSLGRVADELGLHRNTVRHRVAEIESALGRSLDDPATRVGAWVALQADDARRVDGA